MLARLEAAGLEPSPAAEPRTLLRRLSYVLTGLPPSAEELDAFAADPSDARYEQAVDRLLASPRFGERWARHWLDVARYADTKGYVFEEDRNYTHAVQVPRLGHRRASTATWRSTSSSSRSSPPIRPEIPPTRRRWASSRSAAGSSTTRSTSTTIASTS